MTNLKMMNLAKIIIKKLIRKVSMIHRMKTEKVKNKA